jgi:hypothetical protein
MGATDEIILGLTSKDMDSNLLGDDRVLVAELGL